MGSGSVPPAELLSLPDVLRRRCDGDTAAQKRRERHKQNLTVHKLPENGWCIQPNVGTNMHTNPQLSYPKQYFRTGRDVPMTCEQLRFVSPISSMLNKRVPGSAMEVLPHELHLNLDMTLSGGGIDPEEWGSLVRAGPGGGDYRLFDAVEADWNRWQRTLISVVIRV
ncbi:hypothetical protein Bbelb_355750 [Branchiostoma belcheri]|nr:hypothetical protein Bbelb_355750 [Branchiostoma belcheri]